MFTQKRLEELLNNIKSKRIAVIGDVMIDRYVWGNVNRISPEAPVPVVEVESETSRLGGAANVANVTVEVQNAPQWLTFTNPKTEISKLKSKEASTAKFTFSVDKSAPIGKEQKLEFVIASQTGEQWKKEIALQVSAPEKFELFQNYPNPFNPSTMIKFSLPNSGQTSLKVFDLLGREVAVLTAEVLEAGNHSQTFSTSSLSSGIYFYTLHSGNFSETRKMIG